MTDELKAAVEYLRDWSESTVEDPSMQGDLEYVCAQHVRLVLNALEDAQKGYIRGWADAHESRRLEAKQARSDERRKVGKELVVALRPILRSMISRGEAVNIIRRICGMEGKDGRKKTH